MVVLVLFMLVVIALAVAVVGIVAIPARQQGRSVLTPEGEAHVARAVARASDMQHAAGRAAASATHAAKSAKRTRSA